jgi:hypothetical protein
MTPLDAAEHGTRRGVAIGGGAAVLVYVIIAALTAGWGHTVRPMFDSTGGPAPYQWVNPPARFAPGNVKPKAVKSTIAFQDGRSVPITLNTQDGQLLLGLPSGAIAPRSGDTSAQATITPLDPASLGPPPSGVQADGNAYRVELSYQPSGQPVTKFTAAGNLVLVVPSPAVSVLVSPDGQTWTQKPTDHSNTLQAGTTVDAPGYFLAGATPGTAEVGGTSTSSSDTGRIVIAVVVTVLLATALGVGPVLYRRARGGRATRPAPTVTRRPPGRGGSRKKGRRR